MDLRSVFDGVVIKKLVAVDLPYTATNQHEINGVAQLREFFGTNSRTETMIHWFYFADDEDTLSEDNQITFYDARENHPTRTEWRLYYRGSFLSNANINDTLIIARTKTKIFGLVFQEDSSWLRVARVLFGFEEAPTRARNISEQVSDREINFIAGRIFDALDLDVVLPSHTSDEDIIIEKFGLNFPSTKEMSAFAVGQTEFDLSNPDETLIRLLNREEELFRALERRIVKERLDKGFADVDEFISYSLSVNNRRKSRMGHAFEHHLAYIFDYYELVYERGGFTEAKKKPDFLFPNSESYHNPDFPQSNLVMLGAKSTCKDRWRQVLSEANRIPHKHLCTLEVSISTNQTDEMKQSNLTLVVPEVIQQTYSTEQLNDIWSLQHFIDYVLSIQNS